MRPLLSVREEETMFYDKKRKRWRGQVYYTDSDGKRHRKMIDKPTRKEALRAEEEIKGMKGLIPEKSLLFKMCAESFLKAEETEIRSSTLIHYEKIVRLHLLPFFGEKKMVKITADDIEEWKRELLKKEYSLQYLKHCFKVLRLVFRYASKKYSISDSVLLRVENFKKDPNAITEKKKLNYWTPSEFRKWYDAIEEAIEKEPDSMALEGTLVLVSIGYFAGLRKGEINALRLSDYKREKDGCYLSVNKAVTQNLRRYGTITADPKTSSSVREVRVGKYLQKILDRHLGFLKRLGVKMEDPYLVYGVGPMPNTTAEVIKDRFEKEAGIHHIRIHDLRHSFVSNLINAGIPIEQIAKVCGHSSTSVTFRIYGHLFPSTQAGMMERMDNYFDGSSVPPKEHH